MTGRLSLDRFELLNPSLLLLDGLVRSSKQNRQASTSTSSYEVTWEMAMIELQLWSPSHTHGVVEGSFDSMLRQSTQFAAACKIPFEEHTAQAIQPYLDWFLRYLEETFDVVSEPPWIILYAYKAFLLVWQLMQKGYKDTMRAVGISGEEAALGWARKVFDRRQRYRLGKLIMGCLKSL
jgi:hypothetical protein